MKTHSSYPLAEVGEYTRTTGRVSVHKLLEQLEREREGLKNEKRNLELKLSDIESWKHDETAKLLGQRLTKTRSIEETIALESKVRRKKKPILHAKNTIEERLHDINGRLKDRQTQSTRDDVNVLLRIESLLIRMCEEIGISNLPQPSTSEVSDE